MSDVAVNLEVARLADQLERSVHGGAWHGPAVLESLEGIGAEDAARRSVSTAHSVWEIAGHTAAWMRVAARRIRGESVPTLPEEENFPKAHDLSEDSWRGVVRDVREAYRELVEVLRGLEDTNLGDPVSGSDPTVRGLLLGVIQHNAYHAGQIVILSRALGEDRASS